MPIDYEHQTLGGGYASPTGQAPAAGWIKRLFVVRPVGIACRGDEATEGRSDEAKGQLGDEKDSGTPTPSFSLGGRGGAGLYAEVEWTEPARAQLAARQYRYLSPVAIVRKSDRRLVALHSAALTNKPAIVGMRAIVNRDPGFGARVPGRTPRMADGQEDASRDNAGRRGRGDAEQGRRRRKEVRGMTEVLERLRGQLGLAAEEQDEAVLLA
ncbi:MAG: phage protease, partial [Phycisphaerae bacterium]